MLESKLWHNKTGTKNVKVGKMWNLSKLVTNTFASLILVFFQLHNPPPFYWGKRIFKNRCFGEKGNFLMPRIVIIKNLEESTVWGHE